ncbi:cytochrome C [Reinekea sp.]|jgi:mono/diheme cytochrome c family protein|uniref:cytochrome C n=1 Tax=Reinekea sp. TaxID=1970455 RepID=UPI00398A0432
MKKSVLVSLVSGIVLTSAIVLTWLNKPMAAESNLEILAANVKNGAYLARMAGCIACHTDPDSEGGPLAGGPILESDFGSFAAPNITQDVEHGIGNWTIEQFDIAVRQGISPSGEPYYPAFPYEFYSAFTDQDIADLWGAFKTVPASNRPDPKQEIPFPFNIRSGIKAWRTVFAQPVKYEYEGDKMESYNRGKFIMEGPAHCAACHTPRNFAGALQIEQSLHGSDNLPGDEFAPPIDAVSLLNIGWTQDDLAYALQTGTTPEGDALGGSMGEVIMGGTRYLSWSDLMAISEYLLTEK